ncbi:MAG TPA: hypothetical protein ENG54_03305 [Thermofilum sp.]|nr:hypothetical protein [Thermofilum sp.]
MPFIVLTAQRKVLLIWLSVFLAAIPIFVLVTAYRAELLSQRITLDSPVIKSTRVNTLLVLSVLLGIIPYAVVDFFNRRYIDSINKNLGPFFKGLGESIRAGLPFVEALESVARITPGPLGKEMRDIIVKVELGMPLEDALRRLADRLGVVSFKRAIIILITAYQSGGKVVDVLDSAAEMYAMLRAYEEERRTQVSPYFTVVYVAISIFLFISFILIYVFVKPLGALAGMSGAFGGLRFDVAAINAILFYTAVFQSFFGGLIIGKLKANRIGAGLLHTIFMLTITLVYFNLLEIYGDALGRMIFPTPTP